APRGSSPGSARRSSSRRRMPGPCRMRSDAASPPATVPAAANGPVCASSTARRSRCRAGAGSRRWRWRSARGTGPRDRSSCRCRPWWRCGPRPASSPAPGRGYAPTRRPRRRWRCRRRRRRAPGRAGRCGAIPAPASACQSSSCPPPGRAGILPDEARGSGPWAERCLILRQGATADPLRRPARARLHDSMQRVLVVDDEPELVRLLGRTLGQAGFSAVGARSGEHALELLGQQEFDAALVDKNLGRGIDGVEVLRHLRKRQPRCACIIMTAYPSMGSAVEALRIGAQDYVEKPSPELDTIADRVNMAIRAIHLRDERDGLLVKLKALQEELKAKDESLRNIKIDLAMAEQVTTVRVDEAKELLARTYRDRDARLI